MKRERINSIESKLISSLRPGFQIRINQYGRLHFKERLVAHTDRDESVSCKINVDNWMIQSNLIIHSAVVVDMVWRLHKTVTTCRTNWDGIDRSHTAH